MEISSTMRWNSLTWLGNLLSRTIRTSRSETAVFQCRSTVVPLWHGQDQRQVSQRKVRAFPPGFASGRPSPMRSAPCLLCLSHHNHIHHRKFLQQSVRRSFSPHPSRPTALPVVRQAAPILAQPAVTLRRQVLHRWKVPRRVSVAASAIILRASAAPPLPLRLSQLCRRFL